MTLIELIIGMIVVSIIVAATLFFANPVRQASDIAARAELTDIANNALQRMARDVKLALPNSVRTNGTIVEFIPVRTAGRYRVTPAGACSGANDDELAFDVSDSCFKSIGAIPNDTSVTTSDFLVLNNYGDGFSVNNQDAYAGGNRRAITAAIVGQQKVTFASGTFDRKLHDSPGKRFYIVTTPVAYVCDLAARTITRYSGYGFTASLTPASITGGASAVIASDVTGCSFDYAANVAPMVGLLTLRLRLGKTVSTGSETLTLYHSVHVANVP